MWFPVRVLDFLFVRFQLTSVYTNVNGTYPKKSWNFSKKRGGSSKKVSLRGFSKKQKFNSLENIKERSTPRSGGRAGTGKLSLVGLLKVARDFRKFPDSHKTDPTWDASPRLLDCPSHSGTFDTELRTRKNSIILLNSNLNLNSKKYFFWIRFWTRLKLFEFIRKIFKLLKRNKRSLRNIVCCSSIHNPCKLKLWFYQKLHVVYLFMPLRPITSRAANSNSLNSVIFAELELELEK